MLLSQSVKSGEVWEINEIGSSFAVIRAQIGLYAKFYDAAGSVVMNTELNQGIKLAVNYTKIVLLSKTDMQVQVWASKYAYDFTAQPDRARTALSRIRPLTYGINKLLEYDPPRLRASIKSDIGMYIGGENMRVNDGIVENARYYPANSSIETAAYGDLMYFISNATERVLYQSASQEVKYVTQTSITRAELEQNSVDYFDIKIPPSHHNKTFTVMCSVSHDSQSHVTPETGPLNITIGPALFVTNDDIETHDAQSMTRHKFMGGGGAWSGSLKTYPVAMTLKAGTHRVFMAESALDYDAVQKLNHVNFGQSFCCFESISSTDDVFLIIGSAEIFEERA
ncbi:hypothetical protein [Pseudoalteromonas aurantia]|uniref:Uncharacterized protein n=1 Tax=Pseudoalteromonas aurantia TaxID=43654 RepID=A0A5S3V4Y0_9GAMM|nr:hypothetical protein [Pseudoalteromonas aurantia]TMO66182.1 hypothetical protein CWC19_16790 [Pseudoalteromonas aurantia]